ncbi:MlaD family protein [Arcticibacter tournemirensis]|uniref:MCE family protein n=1 Tax=Arcticibacter tournemirensis TaxID=699437 RepID=A0A4Q0MF60_9SPHI|nr:MlaD family protein [Arcticibacter tournemirensis]RXF71914.1 MCE family protein [Arcticibacter tournemirensis]
MEATENKRSVIVGIFVLLGIVVFVAGIFTLAGQQKRFVKSIELNAVFNDVAGLKAGNNVWFSGVKVGTVKKIDFYGIAQVKIKMSIEEEAQKYIHKNAFAQISSEGFIGNRIIVIDGGSPNLPIVENGDILRAKNSVSTDQMLADLQANNRNLIDITGNLKIISTRIAKGEGAIGALLTDSVMALNLRATMTGLRDASQNINRTAVSLSNFSSKLNTKGGLVDELLTDTVVFKDLKSSIAEIQKLSVSASSLSANLDNAGKKLNETNSPVGLLLNDQQSAESLRKTIMNLETSTKKLDENLEALQHNFLLRGFFRKKEKESRK